MIFSKHRLVTEQRTIQAVSHMLKTMSTATSAKKLFTNTLNLPSLPVHTLNQTLEKYIKTVAPFLNEHELSNTKKLLDEFNSENGIGKKLQKLLIERAKVRENWLEEWWLNTAYLEYRDPVVVYSSPGLVFPFEDFTQENDRLKYTANLILAAIQYYLKIWSDQLPLDKMGNDPLDMNQYKKIFGTCRIPKSNRDTLQFNPNSIQLSILSL